MSPCEKYQELISRMVDGELSAREERELAAHLDSCPACAALFQAFSALSGELSGDLEEAPLDLRENVMAEIRREELRKRNRLPIALRGVLSVAACAVVILGAYLGVSITRGARLSTAASGAFGEEKAVVRAAQEESRALDEAAPAAEAAMAPLQVNEALPAATPVPPRIPAAADKADAAYSGGAPAAEPAAAPAPAEEERPAEEAEPMDALAAEDSASEEIPEPELEEYELSNWDLSLLRKLLGGSPSEQSMEELAGAELCRIRLHNGSGSWTVLIYERDGRLYYLDPLDELLYEAELSPEELEQFLKG